MVTKKLSQYVIEVNLRGQPLSQAAIDSHRKKLRAVYRTNLNYILAIFVLGSAVTYRALSLSVDSEFELLKMSLYIGLWFGVFTGLMVDGDGKRKFQMVLVCIVVNTSANLFASMLVTLFIGEATTWITSVNIIASALACMWVMTSYDEVLKGFDGIQFVNKRQQSYIKKAASYFEELNFYKQKINQQGRPPLRAEYWAVREWIQAKNNANHSR